MAHAAERDDAQARPDGPPAPPLLTRPPVILGITVAFVAVTAWNLSLARKAPAPLAEATVTETLQTSLMLATQAVEAFRQEHGRLPASMEELGFPANGFDYRVIGDDYELRAHVEGQTLTADTRHPDENPLAELGVPLPEPPDPR